jgi:hypothetical protein
MGSTLALVGAVGCTLVAAYQWAARLGAFGEATTVLAARDWQAARGAPHSSSSSGWVGWFYS